MMNERRNDRRITLLILLLPLLTAILFCGLTLFSHAETVIEANGVSFDDFCDAMESMNGAPDGSLFIYDRSATSDVTLYLNRTVHIDPGCYLSASFTFNDMTRRVILKRASGFTGPLFSFGTDSVLSFCSNYYEYADAEDDRFVGFVIDNGNSSSPIFSGEGVAELSGVLFRNTGKISDGRTGVRYDHTPHYFFGEQTGTYHDYPVWANDYGSLQAAIDAAPAGTTVCFSSDIYSYSRSNMSMRFERTVNVTKNITLAIDRTDNEFLLPVFTAFSDFSGDSLFNVAAGVTFNCFNSDLDTSVYVDGVLQKTRILRFADIHGTFNSHCVDFVSLPAYVYIGGSVNVPESVAAMPQIYDEIAFGSDKSGITMPDSLFVAEGTTTHLPDPPTVPGYTFNYYYDSYADMYAPGDRFTVREPVLLGSAWTLSPLTVTADLDDSYLSTYGNSISLTFGVSHPLAARYPVTYKWYREQGQTLTEVGSDKTLVCTTPKNAMIYYCIASLTDGSETVYAASNRAAVTINKAKVTPPSVSSQTFTYNGSAQSLQIPASSLYTVSGNSATNAGSYTATVTLKNTANYTWSDGTTAPKTYAFTIAKAPLTVRADSVSVVTGDPVPTYTATYVGFVGNEGVPALSGSLRFTCSYTASSPAGSYTLTPSGLSSQNYAITFENGSVTVTPGYIPIPGLDGKTELVYNGQTQIPDFARSLNYTVTGGGREVGSYTLTLSLVDKQNRRWSDGSTTDKTFPFTIVPAPLLLRVNDVTVSYGDPTPTFSYTASGFVGGDGASGFVGRAVYGTDYEPGSGVGTYRVTLSGLSAANYTVTFEEGSLTVCPKEVPFPVLGNIFMEYNGREQTPDITVTDDCLLTGSGVKVGLYSATVSLKDPVNTVWVNGTTSDRSYSFMITERPLSVRAKNISVPFGASVPEFDYEAVGFIEGEGPEIITGIPVFSCNYEPGSPIGSYTIGVHGLFAENYQIEYFDGTLVCGMQTVVIPKPADLSFVYNGSVQRPTLGGENGYNAAFPESVDAGEYELVLTLLDPDNTVWEDGTSGEQRIAYKIEKAAYDLTGVTLEDATVLYDGQPHGLTLSGALPAGLTVDYGENAFTEAGSYTVTATFISENPNYEIPDPMSATLTVVYDDGLEELRRQIIEELRSHSPDVIPREDIREDFIAKIGDFVGQAQVASSADGLYAIRDEADRWLENLTIDLTVRTLPGFPTEFYEGDRVEGFLEVRLVRYMGEEIVAASHCAILYPSGEAFHSGDGFFTVSCADMTARVDVPTVRPAENRRVSAFIDAACTEGLRFGDPLPTLTGYAVDENGKRLEGSFSFAKGSVLHGGVCEYPILFESEGRVYSSSVRFEVSRLLPEFRLITDHAALTYGDPFPELPYESGVEGYLQFDCGQSLHAGSDRYTGCFCPYDDGYAPVPFTVTLDVAKAKLKVRAKDLTLFIGQEPTFTLVYEGFAYGEDSRDLDVLPTVVLKGSRKAPSADIAGEYTVIPCGGESQNYEFIYTESLFALREDIFAPQITDTDEKIEKVCDLGEGSLLHVETLDRSKVDGLDAALAAFADPSYLAGDRVVRVYRFTFEGKVIPLSLSLDIPIDESANAVRLLSFEDGKVRFDPTAVQAAVFGSGSGTLLGRRITFELDGDGVFLLLSSNADEAVGYLTALLTRSDLTDADKLGGKRLFDALPDASRLIIPGEALSRASELLTVEMPVVELIGSDKNGVTVDPSAAALPEMYEENVTRIIVSARAEDLPLPTGGENGTVLRLLDLSLVKAVFAYEDGNSVVRTTTVPDSEITKEVYISIPYTPEMYAAGGLQVYRVEKDGSRTFLRCETVTEGESKSLTFRTDRFSVFEIRGVTAGGAENTREGIAAWAIIGVLAVSAIAVLCVGAAAGNKNKKSKRREEKES